MPAVGLTRPVRRLLLSHALASLAMSLPWPLLLVLVWDKVGDTAHGDLLLGLTAAARMLPYVLVSWATGMLADRFSRDRLVRATLAARALLLTVTAVAVAVDALSVAVTAAAVAIACGTPAYPALAAAMPGVAGPDRRRATDLLVTIEVASFVVGPAVGGLLLGDATRGWLPALAVAITVAATVPLRGVRLPRPVRDPDATGHGAAGTLAALRGSASATRAVGVAGLINAVGAALLLALLPLAEDAWRGGEAQYGLAAGMFGFGALAAPALWRLGSSTGSRQRRGLLLLGVGLLLVPFAPAVGWAILPLLVAGAATVHVEGAVTEAIQDAVRDDQRAGMLGLTDSVMVAAAMIGSLAAPALASVLGAGPFVAVLALACLVVVAPAGVRLRTRNGPVRRTGAEPQRQVSRPAAAPELPVPRQRRPARPHARSSSVAAPRG
jgi:MFS family permease